MKAVWRLVAVPVLALAALTACAGQSAPSQIKAVIEKADHEQEDAFAARNPAIMSDTNTARNLATMARANDEFASAGIVGIRLVKLQWGPINVAGGSATATNWETWEQTDADGNIEQQTEREVYKLLKVGTSWQIDEIDYPDETGGAPGSAPPPTPAAAPSG